MKPFNSLTLDTFELYELENDFFKMQVTNYGARLVSFVIKSIDRNVVLGYPKLSDYKHDTNYMGASVGRVCNRIGKGEFKLNHNYYKLNINNGPNSLHGGCEGFDRKFWKTTHKETSVLFECTSLDMEEGYPGNLHVSVEYILTMNGFEIEIEGNCDQDTLFSMTNHSFFNLEGNTSLTIKNHQLQINAEEIGMIDENGLSQEKLISVIQTPFDFRKPRLLKDVLESNHTQVKLAKGIDHHYCVLGTGLRKMVMCQVHDCLLTVYSNLPGFHLYTGNYLDNYQSGICFETQYYPNAINYTRFQKPILKKGETKVFKTIYEFKVKGELNDTQ